MGKMALTGCYAFMKHIVTLLNVLYLSFGVLLMLLAVWLWVDTSVTLSMAEDRASYYTGVYLILFVGTLLLIVGFLGCAAAISESQCSLVLYFCLLLIVLVAEISAGIWMYSNNDKLKDLVRYTVKSTVQSEYGSIKIRTDTFDAIQSGYECCGAYGASDWGTSAYNNPLEGSLGLAISFPEKPYKIPASCCKGGPKQCSDDVLTAVASGPISELIYSEGCTEKLMYTTQKTILTFLVLLVAMCSVEFFGLILALILCCAIRAVNTYKN